MNSFFYFHSVVERLRLFLGTEVDNSPLILFRMCFGFLIAAESFGAILTGWVDKTLIKPVFTFNVIGFDWIQPLDGNGMIFYFCAMGCTGILMMLGLFYRYAAGTFSVMWTLVYMMQKTHYNNHYYLLVLLGFVMLLLPANRAYSLDVKFGFIASRKSCARICHYFFITQIVIVYLYASFHKMNPDWIAAKSIGIWFEAKKHYFLIGPLLGKEWFQLLICWGGIVYDGIIVFLLLYKPTRKFGFILSVVFNLFNSVVFQ
ncbi:MAG: HTTM domain-containing protein, partial [Bacteroidota bacterium]